VKHIRFGRSREPMHLAVKRLSPLADGDAHARLMPTPRATWLVEPHSVESDLSRFLSFSQAPPLRVRCRSAASCAVARLTPLHGESDLREPSPHSVTRVRHQRALAETRSVVSFEKRLRDSLIRREIALTPPSPRLAHPFATFPLQFESPRSDPPINPVFGLVRDASTSRESYRC